MPDTTDNKVTNIVIAGLGGQGVIKASDILAGVLFDQGYDIKKSEIHGMSQRGGSVTSDIRFGKRVLSPKIPDGQADFVIVLAEEEVENNRRHLKPGGVLIDPDSIDLEQLANKRSLNVALLGRLSTYFEIPDSCWIQAVESSLAPKLHEVNRQAFALGQSGGQVDKK